MSFIQDCDWRNDFFALSTNVDILWILLSIQWQSCRSQEYFFFLFSWLELSHGGSWHNSYNCVRCRTYRVRFWYDALAAALYQDMIVDEKNLKDSLHFNSLNVHCDTVMEMVTLHWQSTWHYKTDNKRLLRVFGFWEKIKRIIHRCLQLWWCSACAHWCCVEFEYQKDVCCGELENKESLVNGTTTLRITFAKLAYRFGSECTQLQVLTNVVWPTYRFAKEVGSSFETITLQSCSKCTQLCTFVDWCRSSHGQVCDD